MYEKFLAISEEKQKAIKEAAILIFSEHGYEKAKTDEICKKAGISKGLLFHYFGSKKNLYLYLLDDITEEMTALFYQYMKQQSQDLMDILAESMYVKLRIAMEMPVAYKMMYEAYVQSPADLKQDIEKRLSGMLSNQRESFQNLFDTSQFKDGISAKLGTDLVWACSKGLFDLFLEDLKHLDAEESINQLPKIREEMACHFALLKETLYKKTPE